MDDRDLCYLSAVEALALFRGGALSPLDLLRALMRCAEEVEPHINAFTERYFEEALERAAEAEQRYVRGEARALEGLPVAIKDEPEIRGKRTTQGSLVLKDEVTDYARDYLTRSRSVGPREFLASLTTCSEMYDDFGPLMERNELFVCPTVTTTRVKADFNYLHDTIEIGGKRINPELGIAMCHQFNMLSRCPVLAVPSGTASNGVPTGVQLVGRTYDDETVFRAGAALETARPFFRDTANRPVL